MGISALGIGKVNSGSNLGSYSGGNSGAHQVGNYGRNPGGNDENHPSVNSGGHPSSSSGGNSNQNNILTDKDKAAINKLKELGFSEEVVTQVYLICQKNEELAANYLFENNFG